MLENKNKIPQLLETAVIASCKLELKHLVPYLPYGLKYLSPKRTPTSIFDWAKEETIEEMGCISMIAILRHGEQGKPVLRPLSEIKSIEEISEQFSEYSWESFQNSFFLFEFPCLNAFDHVNYTIVELCFKHHLDIFGLINKGLAIDVNTIDKV